MSIWAGASAVTFGLGGFFFWKSGKAGQRSQDLRSIKYYTDWEQLEKDVEAAENKGVYAALQGRIFSCDPVKTVYASDGKDNDLPAVMWRIFKDPDSYGGGRGLAHVSSTLGRQLQLFEDWDLKPREGHGKIPPLGVSRHILKYSDVSVPMKTVYTGYEPAYSILSDVSGYNISEQILAQHAPITLVGTVIRKRHAMPSPKASAAESPTSIAPTSTPDKASPELKAAVQDLNSIAAAKERIRLVIKMPRDGRLVYATTKDLADIARGHDQSSNIYFFFTVASSAVGGFCGYKAARGLGVF
jgi:hypothetical protein